MAVGMLAADRRRRADDGEALVTRCSHCKPALHYCCTTNSCTGRRAMPPSPSARGRREPDIARHALRGPRASLSAYLCPNRPRPCDHPRLCALRPLWPDCFGQRSRLVSPVAAHLLSTTAAPAGRQEWHRPAPCLLVSAHTHPLRTAPRHPGLGNRTRTPAARPSRVPCLPYPRARAARRNKHRPPMLFGPQSCP